MGDSDKVRFGGRIVDRRTAEMLAEAQRLAQAKDPDIKDFKLNQGSFTDDVAASGGTHDGAGAFDLSSAGYTEHQKEVIGLMLRTVGFASWRRYPSQGNWEEHWHGIARGAEGLSPNARNQVQNYADGKTGLRGGGRDEQPRPANDLTWEQYQATHGLTTGTSAPAEPETTADRDHDGLTDAFEEIAGTDRTRLDSDGDGLTDGYEAVSSHTDPTQADTDGDGTTDADEIARGTDPGRLTGTAGVVGVGVFAENVREAKDSDEDGLSNHFEKLVGTDPDAADTDGDGLNDATEATLGTDPTLVDSDYDGVTDGLEVSSSRDPLSARLDASGRRVETERWTPESAYQRRSGNEQRSEAPPGEDEPPEHAEGVPARQTSPASLTQQTDGNLEAGEYGGMRLTRGMAAVASQIAATTSEVADEQGWDDAQRRRATTIAIATAMKESTLGDDRRTNDPNDDFDAGIFQQRIRPGWYGTLEQVRDVRYATRAFLLGHTVPTKVPGGAGPAGYHIPGLAQVSNWEHLSYSKASHAVQRSAFPEIPPRFIKMAEAVTEAGPVDPVDPVDPAGTVHTNRLPGAGPIDGDADHDGLTDAFEALAGTSAQERDTDHDGLDDAYEALTSHSDPRKTDTDGDGLTDAVAVATGRDPGRLPGTAGVVGSGIFAENVRDGVEDADHDGLSDHAEEILRTALDRADTDGDDLDDAVELTLGTDPRLGDTDHDGLLDGLEVRVGSNPTLAGSGLTGWPGSPTSGSTANGQDWAGVPASDHLDAAGAEPAEDVFQ